MKFRKKPVEIEAMRFTEQDKNRVFYWITCNKSAGHNEDRTPYLTVQTLKGCMVVDLGDWIIKGVKGDFYPIKDDMFRETYEAVVESGKESQS